MAPHLFSRRRLKGVVDVARVLLERGADTKKLSSDMQAPTKIAADNGHVAVVRVLLVTGAERRPTGLRAEEGPPRGGSDLDTVSILSVPVSLRRGTDLGFVWHQLF